jgi:hypothetical protein
MDGEDMLVEERVVSEVVSGAGWMSSFADEATSVSWFAARQPGIVRHLALRCGENSDAMAVALHFAHLIAQAFERQLGLPAPRAPGSLLERAEKVVIQEAQARLREGGLASRQPALAQLVASVVAEPPLLLDEREKLAVGLSLAAIVYALDVLAFGRPAP